MEALRNNMQMGAEISFSLIEWLAITGLTQCVLAFVYVLFRVKSWSRTLVVLAYFFVLAASFSLQFSLRIEEYQEQILMMRWFSWLLISPLSYLLVLQVAKDKVPAPREFLVLMLVPLVTLIAFVIKDFTNVCEVKNGICGELFEWLYWLGSISGIISMLLLWGHKDIFGDLWRAKTGKEKYWLVMVLIAANVVIVSINLLRSTGSLEAFDADSILTIMGMTFVYITSTTMFRVYPPPISLSDTPNLIVKALTSEEKKIADKIKKLMTLDKLYHDVKFDRATLARELEISENVVSRVINVAFNKSFPRLLSEFRVEDAKRMLGDPEIPVNIVASEVGFNSIASFNRIFKEIEGVSPSKYRQSLTEI